MKTQSFVRTVILFVVLATTGIAFIAVPQSASSPILRSTLPLVGVGLFTASLTFFLVAMAQYQKK